MDNQNIDISKVIRAIINELIVKLFTMPYKIYMVALTALSNSKNEGSEERSLPEFPVLVWISNSFNAAIALLWPIGALIALFSLFMDVSPFGGPSVFMRFVIILIVTYFTPFIFGTSRELFLMMLRKLMYLKIISKK